MVRLIKNMSCTEEELIVQGWTIRLVHGILQKLNAVAVASGYSVYMLNFIHKVNLQTQMRTLTFFNLTVRQNRTLVRFLMKIFTKTMTNYSSTRDNEENMRVLKQYRRGLKVKRRIS